MPHFYLFHLLRPRKNSTAFIRQALENSTLCFVYFVQILLWEKTNLIVWRFWERVAASSCAQLRISVRVYAREKENLWLKPDKTEWNEENILWTFHWRKRKIYIGKQRFLFSSHSVLDRGELAWRGNKIICFCFDFHFMSNNTQKPQEYSWRKEIFLRKIMCAWWCVWATNLYSKRN